jgi:hypothetical protein
MHFFLSIFIFLFVLFFYVHLQYQFKTSNDLEIYELDYSTNTQLQEICHLKQPVLFQLDIFKDLEVFFKSIELQSIMREWEKEDVGIKDIRDYYKPNSTSIDSVYLSFSSAKGLMDTDPKGHFFSENNSDLVREISVFSKMDSYLATPWNIHKSYDLLFGSKNVHTPLKFHTDTSRFLIISSSTSTNNTTTEEISHIRIKMTPWKNRKYLEIKYDYENYEFWSPIDIWNNPPDKIKCLEFDVKEGYVIYIPPYWFYSIEFTNNHISVASFTYSTGMNLISNLPNYGLFFLQQNNIRNLGEMKNIKKVYSDNIPVSEKEKEVDEDINNNDNKSKEDISPEIKEMLSVISVSSST